MRAASDRGRLVETAFEGSRVAEEVEGRPRQRSATPTFFVNCRTTTAQTTSAASSDGTSRPRPSCPGRKGPTSDRSRAGVPLTLLVSRGVPAARLRSRHELGNDSARARRDRAHSRDDDPQTSRPPGLESLALKAQLRGESLLVEPIVYTLDEGTLSRYERRVLVH